MMKIELEDIMFWMDAIRNSDDRFRTLESFWKGQLRSKVWLAEKLYAELNQFDRYNAQTVAIHGGWNGVLASILFNSPINIDSITSVDIDPACKAVAETINKRQHISGKFNAVTADMCKHAPSTDIVINTSCEHITQAKYNKWLQLQPNSALCVLQSNNYYEIDEHVRCANSVEDFLSQSQLQPKWAGELKTPDYTRYMIIGRKHV